MSRIGNRTTVADVFCQCLADRIYQRQSISMPLLAVWNCENTLPPVDVFQFQRYRINSTEAQLEHTDGHGVVTFAYGRGAVECLQKFSALSGIQNRGRCACSPSRNTWNGSQLVVASPPIKDQKSIVGSQNCIQTANVVRRMSFQVADYVIANCLRSNPLRSEGSAGDMIPQEEVKIVAVLPDRPGSESSGFTKETAEFIYSLLNRITAQLLRWLGFVNDAHKVVADSTCCRPLGVG